MPPPERSSVSTKKPDLPSPCLNIGPIRSNAETVINENSPKDARSLLAYYNLEQYPDTYLFYGPMFSDAYAGQDAEQPYKVVGVLKKTGTILDNLILTSLDSVWNLHSVKNKDKLEITSLLLKYKNKTSSFSFPRLINKGTNMQAASPSFEISKLLKLTGNAHRIVDYLSVLIIILSFLGILFTLLNNINEFIYPIIKLCLLTSEVKFLIVT